MTLSQQVTVGDLIAAASFVIAAIALFLTLYQLRKDARRKQAELTALALTAQLGTLIQIQGMPEDKRKAAWGAIASAPGGPGKGKQIEEAIATQIGYLDRIANGELVTTIPTYGRKGSIGNDA